jgi:hypothetical protein
MPESLHFYKFTGYSDNLLEELKWDSIYDSIKALFKRNNQFVQRTEEAISKHFEPIILDRAFISVKSISEEAKDFDNKIKYVFDEKASSFFMVDDFIWVGIEKIINSKKNTESEKQAKISNKLEIEKEFIQDYFILKNCFDKNNLFVNIS